MQFETSGGVSPETILAVSRGGLLAGETVLSNASFLARPVLINTISWSGVAPAANTISFMDVLALWLANASVARRMYGFLKYRGKLCLRIEVNGNPYGYGRYFMGIRPVSPPDGVSFSWADTRPVLSTLNQLVQLPYVMIDPAVDSEYLLCQRTLSPSGWLQVGTTYGRCPIQLVLWSSVLKSSTTATAASVPVTTIKIWAWMEDAELAVLVAQAGEDVAGGAVSRTASAVGSAMKALKAVPIPVVSWAAGVAELVANTTATVATALGFSKPAALDTMAVTHFKGNSDFAHGMGSRYFGWKTSLDPKCSLAITPDAAGVGDMEETQLRNIAAREGWITTVGWTSLNTVGTQLFAVPVHPFVVPTGTLNPTPLAFVTLPFECWGGDIKYRFHIAHSAYHRGAVRVVYDPLGIALPAAIAAADTNLLLSKIVVLSGTGTDFEFCVPWSSDVPFVRTMIGSGVAGTYGASLVPYNVAIPTIVPPNYTPNGKLYIFVDNLLVCNGVAADVEIYCFVSGCSNIRYHTLNQTAVAGLFPLMAQSGVAEQDPLEVYMLSGGEAVIDIKQIAKRYQYEMSVYSAQNGGVVDSTFYNSSYIPATSFIPAITGPNVVVGKAFSTGGLTLISWFESAFAAQRGGYRFAFRHNNNQNALTTFCAGRAFGGLSTTFANGASFNPAIALLGWGFTPGGGPVSRGATPVRISTSSMYEVEIPSSNCALYRNANCGGVYSPVASLPLGGPLVHLEYSFVFNPGNNLIINSDVYISGADDYSLYGYMYTPNFALYV